MTGDAIAAAYYFGVALMCFLFAINAIVRDKQNSVTIQGVASGAAAGIFIYHVLRIVGAK